MISSCLILIFLVGCSIQVPTPTPEPSNTPPIVKPQVETAEATLPSIVEPQVTPGEIIPLQQMGGIVYMDPDVSITNADGREMRMGPPATLPRRLPDDVPVYPPDNPLIGLSWTIWKIPGEANLRYNVNVQTSMEKETVHGWYKSQLESNGWTIESETVDPNNTSAWAIWIVINAIKADRTLKVTIGNTGDSPPKTNIDLFTLVPEG
jgi:hypothetical protein